MATLAVTDELGNLLRRALLSASSADGAFGLEGLRDLDGGRPFRFATASGPTHITADLELPNVKADGSEVRDGGYEASDMAAGGHTSSSVGSGNVADLDGTVARTGSKSLKLTVAATGPSNYTSAITKLGRVPTGQRGTVMASLLGNGTVPAAARLYIPELNRYLTAAGTFGAAGVESDIWSQSASSWVDRGPLAFVLPTYEETGLAHVSLWKVARAHHDSVAGAAWVDDFRACLSPDTLLVHGHNICPFVSVAWQASATGAFAGEETTIAAPPVRALKFFHHLAAACDLRFQRLAFSGVNADQRAGGPMIWFGELALAQGRILSRPADWEADEELSLAETADHAQERLSHAWLWRTGAERTEWIREMLERARYGEWPIWVVPVLAEPNVLFCRARGSTSAHRLNSSIRRGAALQLSEEPFPTWVG